MQGFSNNNGNAPASGPKNYVFVDEHNRHKRLKVMRACEGCRRRKIKCDAATTNSWPCAACTRLKLHCVPPVGGVDADFITGASSNSDENLSIQTFQRSQSGPVQPNNISPQNYSSSSFHSDQGLHYESYQHNNTYQKPTYLPSDHAYDGLYGAHQQLPHSALDGFDPTRPPGYQQVRSNSEAHSIGSIDQHTAEDLSQHLGDLKIAENGTAPYVRQQNKDIAEPDGPVQESEFKLYEFSTEAGSHIRIPPLLMPSQEDAQGYFKVFFRDVHPYVPVICRNQFYHQWSTDKESISPLLLEAVFACAGRMSNDPAEGAQWLALANRHEASFLDTPRLSTLQALLLLLKARESAPKKGYYYRSWMTVKTIVSMAKDLDLHEHHDIHEAGEDCGSDPIECLTKTRIWQTSLAVEMMVGGPQGRYDMGVDPKTVDVSPSPPNADLEDYDKAISRQFAYFLINARNIRMITDVAGKLKREKKLGLNQELVSYNTTFHRWPEELPADLKITMPADGSVPKLTSHFIGNMHTHYHLGIVMLRRPQLTAAEQEFGINSEWRKHMIVCYKSAKTLCKLQEAVLAQFDLTGLLCMQRGINFTIYTILTCVMIHLIAITSPDPEFNSDAKDYFVRHMRILESCISSWPMPETAAQINGLRQAFSADISKPFELKASFPLGTPSDSYHPSPPEPQQQQPQNPVQGQYRNQQPQQQHLLIPQTQAYVNPQISQVQQGSYLATPPVSAVSSDSKPHSPQFQQGYDLHPQSFAQVPASSYFQHPGIAEQQQWNPTPIIDQFNTAFAIPPSALAPPPTSAYGSSPPGMQNISPTAYGPSTQSPSYPTSASYPPPRRPSQQQNQQAYYHHQQQQSTQQQYIDSNVAAAHQMQQQMAHQQQQQQHHQQTYQTPTSAGYVTPREWQQSVARVYGEGGLKRRWDMR